MSRKKVMLIVFIFCCNNLQADVTSFFQEAAQSIKDSVTSFFSSDTLKSMGEMFGVVPDSYTRSYAVWNDSHIPIYSGQQSMTTMLGGTIPNAYGMQNVSTIPSWLNPGTIGATIDPASTSTSAGVTAQSVALGTSSSMFQNTPATLTVLDQHLEFNLYIAQTSDVTTNPLYFEQVESLNDENSTKVYHYRAYTGKQWSKGVLSHIPKVEFLGYTQPPVETSANSALTITATETATVSGSLTSLVFFNNTADDVQVTFTYDSAPLTITLEKNSFNSVSLSDTTKSLRPNNFSFNDVGSPSSFASVQFAPVGFYGKVYTLEVYQDAGMASKAVGLQGIVGGNYDTPLSTRSRDVTPITCNFWRQSVSQSGVDAASAENLLDVPGQVWVVYDSVDTPIMSKVTSGEAITWNLIRPELEKGSGYVYFLYIQTSTDSVAEKFIAEFLYGAMGKAARSMYSSDANEQFSSAASEFLASLDSETKSSSSTLTSDQKVATMVGNLDYSLGSMTDESGTVGYLIGADYFASLGVGAITQNYLFSPAIYNISALVSAFSMYVTKTDSLESNLKSWINGYAQSPSATSSLVEALLISDNKAVYVNSDKTLTAAGNIALQKLLTGPISLQNPGLYMLPVQNRYVSTLSGTVPTGMPTPRVVQSTAMPKYTAETI